MQCSNCEKEKNSTLKSKTMYSSVLPAICLLLLFVPTSHCVYIYGLMLHNPIPHDLGLKNGNGDHYQHDESKSNTVHTFTGHLSDPLRIRCKQDSDCIDDDDSTEENLMYCDRHYGFCDYFRQVGELCRHDTQCDTGLICMFGRCEKPSKPGNKGARCHESSDCNDGLCCARQHGERICKPMLKQGQQCFVPLGGLDYSLNELCPCDTGLECHEVKSKNKRSVHSILCKKNILLTFQS